MNEHGLIKIATLCVLRYRNKFLLLKFNATKIPKKNDAIKLTIEVF